MTDSPLASSFVQARLYKVNPGRPLRVVVIHDMEAPEGPTTAENCAQYFTTAAAGGSAHYCVDTDSIVQCVKEADQAAHAPGTNTDGIGVELCGYARQTVEEWRDETSVQTMHLAAALVADICARIGIPPRWLTDAELADGRSKGLATHAQVSRVFRRSDHTDPGPNFPADEFLQMVTGGPPPASPASTPEDDDVFAYNIATHEQRGQLWLVYGPANQPPIFKKYLRDANEVGIAINMYGAGNLGNQAALIDFIPATEEVTAPTTIDVDALAAALAPKLGNDAKATADEIARRLVS